MKPLSPLVGSAAEQPHFVNSCELNTFKAQTLFQKDVLDLVNQPHAALPEQLHDTIPVSNEVSDRERADVRRRVPLSPPPAVA